MRIPFRLTPLFRHTVSTQDCVVLLHGLGRTHFSMRYLENELEKSGYCVVNRSYPSRAKRIAELTEVVGEGIAECRKRGASRIDFVTHSLGGILVRNYFQNCQVPEARRVVMLAPPNHGSEVVDKYMTQRWYKLLTGLPGQELGTGADSIPNRLKPVPLEIGVIAGTESLDPWFNGIVAVPNDGKVSVASARLAEMKDFLTVAHSHTFMSRSNVVARQVRHFLAEGRFDHEH